MSGGLTIAAVAAGGAAGSVARYLVGRAVQGASSTTFPVGTLTVNVLGCAAVGVLAAWFLDDAAHPVLRAALVIGFCGGFTTFSSFSLETLQLLGGGAWGKALLYAMTSAVLCVAATAIGFQVVARR